MEEGDFIGYILEQISLSEQFAEDQALIHSYCRAAGESRKEAKENEHEIQFSYDERRLH